MNEPFQDSENDNTDFISDELEGTTKGDSELNRLNTAINQKLYEILNEKDPDKKYKLQSDLNSLKRERTYYYLKMYIKKTLFFLFLVMLFSFNFISLAVSLSINRTEGIMMRIFGGLYAFFFSIIYLILNYKKYKLPKALKENDLSYIAICPNNPFKFF